MRERRRSPRFGLWVPIEAHVSLLEEVVVEDAEEHGVTVLSDVPGIRGEVVTMCLGPSDRSQLSVTLRTVSSEPLVEDGHVRHRLFMTVAAPLAGRYGTLGASAEWWVSDTSTSFLMRHYPGRVVNVNRGGCLVDLAARLPVGVAATLMGVDPDHQSDPVRILSLSERRGVSWPFRARMEFLPLRVPSSRTFTALSRRLEARESRNLRPTADAPPDP